MIDYERRPAQYRGTIEVYADQVPPGHVSVKGEWRWRCRSRNNSILASGEGYRRRAGALNAIDAQYAARFTQAAKTTRAEVLVVPWRLVIRDRHGDIDKIGAVY